jgi:starch synthase
MIKKNLNILFVASEVAPFAKTGGLADVAGALPKALSEMGHNVVVVMPRYYAIDKTKLTHIEGPLGVSMGFMGEFWAGVYSTKLSNSNAMIYFIDYEEYFGRGGLYDHYGEAYMDNDNRFIFFSKSVFGLCKMIDFKPDVIHANDWHTAAIPLLAQTRFADDFGDAATVLTLHNLEHQGNVYKGAMDILESGWEHFHPEAYESMDRINLLKGGIAYADAITTVSRKYAHEIQTSEFGFGLESHIRAHADKLFGILNGVDYDEWSPQKDDKIASKYSVKNMKGKLLCKRDIQKHFHLEQRDDVALIGFVGRFAKQKGIELIAEIIEGVLKQDLQIVMLGTGEKWAEGFFSHIVSKYSGRFGLHVGYSDVLAHKIEAGCDLFLMPSLFEPCGLNQIYSLAYGTLPIVRKTGGLDDTIENFDEAAGSGVGFKFEYASAHALYHTIMWGVGVYYNNPKAFQEMQKRAMCMHFGWDDAAKSYDDVYRYAIYKKRVSKLQ